MDIRDYVIDIHSKNNKLKIHYSYVLESQAILWYKDYEENRFFCPICKQNLIGVKGDRKKHHFRHSNKTEDKQCKFLTSNHDKTEQIKQHITESRLHKKIKIFFKYWQKKHKLISIPAFYISLNNHNSSNDFNVLTFLDNKDNRYHLNKKEIIPMRHLLITEVKEEIRQQNNDNKDVIIPDLIIKCINPENGEYISFNIEIFVTHRVDSIKIEKIKKNNVNCIQINGNKFNTIRDSVDLYKISEYLHTVEYDIEKEYYQLYQEYQKKTELYNQKYMFKKDRQLLAINQDPFLLANKTGSCIKCLKKLTYSKYSFYQHQNIDDFKKCSEIIDYYFNYKIIIFLKKAGVVFYSKNIKHTINEHNFYIYNNYYNLEIKPEQINIHNLNLLLMQNKTTNIINIMSIINLSDSQQNIINNCEVMSNKINNMYNKNHIITILDEKCLFCFSNNKKHYDSCLLSFPKISIYEIENKINKKLTPLLMEKQKTKILQLNIIDNIKQFFKNIQIDINSNDFQFLQNNEYEIDIYLHIKSLNIKQFLLKVYFNSLNIKSQQYDLDCCYITIDYSLLSPNSEVFFDNINIYNFKNLFKDEIESIIKKQVISKSNYLDTFINILTNNNIINSGRDIKYLYKNNFFEFFIGNIKLIRLKINDFYDTEDSIPNIIFSFNYDEKNFYITTKEELVLSSNNKFYLLYAFLMLGWLKGERYPLIKKKNIDHISINNMKPLQLYNIIIKKSQHFLYIYDQNINKPTYSLSINLNKIKNISDFEDLLKNYNNYIEYYDYTLERNQFHQEHIKNIKYLKLKDIEDKKKKLKVLKTLKTKCTNDEYPIIQYTSFKTLFDHKEIAIFHNIRNQYNKIGKIYYINRFLKQKSSYFRDFDPYLHYQLITKENNILVLSKFSNFISDLENLAIFILKLSLLSNDKNNFYNSFMNIISFNEKAPNSVVFFNSSFINQFNINFENKILVAEILSNNDTMELFFSEHENLFQAYYIKKGDYYKLTTLTKYEIESLKKFRFLTGNDISNCLKNLKK